MSVRKIRNTWWIDFRFEGQRYRKKSLINSKAGALDYETTLRQRLIRGESLEPKKIAKRKRFHTFAWEWHELYVKNNNKHSEILGKQYILKSHLIPHFGNHYLDEITSIKIEEYKNIKDKTTLTRKTINNHISCLRKCLKSAHDWELLETVPKVKVFKTPPREFDFLTEEESIILLNHADGMWYEMILLALRTGMRLGELIALDWSAIDFNVNTLVVRRSMVRNIIGSPKNNKERFIPLTSDVASILIKRKKESGYVFTYRGTFLKKDYCRTTISKICEKAGLRRIGWHKLRHSFASHLVQRNAPLKAIQELMGHADIQTTMGYSHLAPSTLRSAIDLLDSNSHGQHIVNTPILPLPQGAKERAYSSIIFANLK